MYVYVPKASRKAISLLQSPDPCSPILLQLKHVFQYRNRFNLELLEPISRIPNRPDHLAAYLFCLCCLFYA